MKKFLLVILLVLCIVPLFAVSSFYKQLPAMFLVELNDTKFVSHTGDAHWKEGSGTETNYYYNDQIIAVLGVNGAYEDVTVEFALLDSDWLYLIDSSDLTISRPFGIDLIVKGKPDRDIPLSNLNVSNLTGSGHVIHMGLQNVPDGETVYTEKKFTAKIPSSTLSYYGNTIWFDVCLVLPAFDTDAAGKVLESVTVNNKTYNVASSNEVYKAQVRVSIKVGDGTVVNDQYLIDLTGTYNASSSSSSTDESLRQILTVTPTASATSMNLQSIGINGTVDVADFSYLTESKHGIIYGGNSAYIFLSSSANGTAAGEQFRLRRLLTNTNAYWSEDTENNSVTFEATIINKEDTSKSVTFDGTAYNNNSTNSYYQIASKSTTAQDGALFYRWYLEGQIQIKLTGDTTELRPGKYTETIYIHVVSPD